MAAATVVLLTDYGLGDEFVGVLHLVIARACPAARVIDLGHEVARHDVRAGALMLRRAAPHLDPEAIVLASVESPDGPHPPRLAVTAAGRRLLAPDNGLLWPLVAGDGGLDTLWDLARTPVARRPVAATFAGRDLLAPVAAALAAGAEPAALGAPLPRDGLHALALPVARREGADLLAHVLAIDGFGNLGLDAAAGELTAAPGDRVDVRVGDARHELRFVRSFGEVPPGELLLYADPSGGLSVAVNAGRASDRLGLGIDGELRIRALP